MADEVRINFGYDSVLLIPANIPPHKELAAGASSSDRLEMLNLATKHSPGIDADNCELIRGSVSYTYDTIEYLEARFAGKLEGKIGLIIGDDLVADFSTWKKASLLAEKADILVTRRLYPSADMNISFQYPYRAVHNPLIGISSSDIRERIKAGKSWRYFVPETVAEYVIENHLYES
ncbi:nicotinate (nicotinamide) nucleotide adenylyltransferase [Brucepastera parasyntrophica]|uniref:nicotinate (nicotinamide) nucleotide adenylyltransferase n=1 Tax=Brucepastera parasyntrophica TaxID=2880008 RepID=UPI003F6E4835|nr:nicotinate (nicotinamide) nucleotide adenylyltransferase [Brucepastera parasyntrophica]